MSRSRRRTPITGITTADSERWDKIFAHRQERHDCRTLLRLGGTSDDLPSSREYNNPWDGAKDGKKYWGRETVEAMPELMRK